MKLRICVEVQDLAVDENGNPCAAGMEMSMEFKDGTKLPTYEEVIEKLTIEHFLEAAGMEGIINAEDCKFITPEEYDEKYADDEYEVADDERV